MSFLIVANWKMNGDAKLFRDYLEKLDSLLNGIESSDCLVTVCPPFTCFSSFSNKIVNIRLGAQDCFYVDNGPYTGEISAKMVFDCGCRYVILGHHERRKYFKESSFDIKLKAENAIKNGLIPIICVGETLEERESGNLESILVEQCTSSLPSFGDFYLAYEPVWAIGKSSLPSVILLEQSFDIISSYSDKIIYGGSVNDTNVEDIMQISDLSGILVGGASISINSFYNIISSVKRNRVS